MQASMLFITKYWKQIVTGFLIFIFFFKGKSIIKNFFNKQKQQGLEILKDSSVVEYQGIPFNLYAIAGEIYEGFYPLGAVSWYENEDEVIEAINSVPDKYIPDLADVYLKRYDTPLIDHVNKWLDKEERKQLGVKYNLL